MSRILLFSSLLSLVTTLAIVTAVTINVFIRPGDTADYFSHLARDFKALMVLYILFSPGIFLLLNSPVYLKKLFWDRERSIGFEAFSLIVAVVSVFSYFVIRMI